MIICAAIKVVYDDDDSIIICGHRHGNCFKVIKRLNDQSRIVRKFQGFITHEGQFLNREDAYQHAVQCGQLSTSVKWDKQDCEEKELYSEDLY